MNQSNQSVQIEQDRYGNKFEVGCKVLCIDSGRKGKVLDMIYGEIHVKFKESTDVEICYCNTLIILESAKEQEIDFIRDMLLLVEFEGTEYTDRIACLAPVMMPLIEAVNASSKGHNEILLQYLEKKYGE